MKATLMDNTADIMSEEGKPIPIKADAWGIVDIQDSGDGISQDAGLCVYIDLGSLSFEVSMTTQEVIEALARKRPILADADPNYMVTTTPIEDVEEGCGCPDVEDTY